jgi:hypothetical protein
MNDKLLEKIISVAYGESNLIKKIKIRRLANKNPEVKELLENYKRTASEVHKLKEEECPEELLTGIKNKTFNVVKRSNTITADFFSIIYRRPLVSAATTIIILVIMLLGIFHNETVQYQYTSAEIALADKQAKQALAIVGKVFNQTNITLKEEVLNSRVAKPIQESMEIVNGLFTSTNKSKIGEIQ